MLSPKAPIFSEKFKFWCQCTIFENICVYSLDSNFFISWCSFKQIENTQPASVSMIFWINWDDSWVIDKESNSLHIGSRSQSGSEEGSTPWTKTRGLYQREKFKFWCQCTIFEKFWQILICNENLIFSSNLELFSVTKRPQNLGKIW